MSDKLSILVDTMEQRPWKFPNHIVHKTSLVDVGSDYSLRGYSRLIGVERKSFMDFAMRTTVKNIDDFMRVQVAKLLKLKFSCIIVEGHPLQTRTFSHILNNHKPEGIINSACYIMSYGLPVLFSGTRDLAQHACLRFLIESKRRLDET